MAFYNAVLRDYSPESGKSQILCRVWISSEAELKSVPKSWFFRFNGKLIKKSEVDTRLLASFSLVNPLNIYCRPRQRKEFPVLINLEFFEGERGNGGKIKWITVDVEEEDTVEVVKWKVENGCGIPTSQQRLIYAGAELKERRTIRQYGIRMEEVIHVVDGVRRGTGGEEKGEDKEGKGCVVCDRRRVGMEEFVVDCGHYYHACCLPPVSREGNGGDCCVVCDAELLGWVEALELFTEEEEFGKGRVREGRRDQERRKMLRTPDLLRSEDDEEDEGIEVDISAEYALQYTEENGVFNLLQKWKEFDEFYYFIAAILIPMTVGATMGSFWGALVGLGMFELLRRRNNMSGEEETTNSEDNN